MDQYIGKMLDNRYEILELIGVGGMAKVYKARCHRLNRLVAIKILRDDLAQDAELRRRFHDESQAVAMLSHPNIVAVYDVSRSSGQEYIVMELIDGINLKQYLQKKSSKLNWREALHFITQIVKALGHAHSRGIIHRDIKPHNIMVLRDGSVKVADFGIARVASAGHSTLTQEALGSVHYISPEQARGSHIDTRSDLYSAGVVLYEMLTGRLPFEGDSPVSVAIQHINGIPLSPRELNPEIPEALEAITMKAMAPNPDDRYLAADDMLTDLEEFRKNPNISFDYNVSELQPEDEKEELEERTQVVQVSVSRAQREQEEEPELPRRRRSRRREEDYDDYDDGYEPRRSPVWPIFLAIIAILAFTVGIFNFLYTSFLQDLLVGPERYTIPNLVGLVYDDIAGNKTVIKDFRITQGSSVADEKPAGTILRQFPDGNTETNDPNAEITVVVSSGPETFLMPNVVNQDYQMAIVTLNNLGLVAEREYATDEEIVSNFVISSIPLADTVMHPGETVTLIISLGPEVKPATVPLMVGKSLEWAQGQIDFNNLGHGLETYEWSDEYPEGTVIEQNPAAYSEVPEGTKVNLIISKGVDPDTLPPPEVTKSFYIALPDPPQATPENPEPSSDVVVTVMEGGQSVWSQTVNTALDAGVWCTVTGTGVKQYDVYIDNVYQKSEVVNFED